MNRYYFHPCVCVCLCVSVSLYIDYLKVDRFRSNLAGWCIIIISRFLSKTKNRSSRTEVTENPYLYFFLLRPLKIFFWCYFPIFIIGEVKCNKLLKKTLKMGRARYVFYWTHQILVFFFIFIFINYTQSILTLQRVSFLSLKRISRSYTFIKATSMEVIHFICLSFLEFSYFLSVMQSLCKYRKIIIPH